MTLRTKTAVLVGGTLTALIAALSVTFHAVFLDRFEKLQEQDALESAMRAISALSDETARLGSLTEDYAVWDETFEFMHNRSPRFLETGLPTTQQATARVNLVGLIDTGGALVLGAALDGENAIAPLPAGAEKVLAAPALRPHEGRGVQGILRLGELVLLVASHPILRSDESGPSRGTLVMARFLDAHQLADLARYAHAALTAHRVDDSAAPEDVRRARSLLSRDRPTLAAPQGSSATTSFAMVEDVFGEPALIFRVESPRRILREGRAGLAYLIGALLIVGVGFGATALYLIQTLVLARLGRLSTEVGRIAADADFSARVSIPGDDELSRLAADVNGMLAALEASRHRLEESESRLRQSQKMEAVGRLAGGIAHDFNNLLGVIIGYAELLQPRVVDDSQQKRVDQILKAAERAASLTRQLLTFSRKQVLQPRRLDLNVVIREMEPMLQRLIGEHIELTTRLDGALGRVRADASQIEQVLMNLAVNARDAMPHHGTLTIETSTLAPEGAREGGLRAEPYAVLTVTDSGVGMDAETLTHIFEPFFTTKGPGQGTGLGLATVYGIVEQSGGSIRVQSEPGCGASFRICLPTVAADDAPAAGAPDNAPPQAAEPGETILLVEDQDMLRCLARDTLVSCGYDVLEAVGSEEALELSEVHSGPIHLLVTDVVMPKLSGPELAAKLLPLRPAMQVLYISGYPDDSLGYRGTLGEDVNFLQKPYAAALLSSRVRQVLDKKPAQA
jgi:signal transduction histidine kinase